MTKDKEVLTTTTSEGKTGFMVCDDQKDEKGKVCTDISDLENEKSAKADTPEKGMLDNNTYNLLEQLNIENKSLWRIKNSYKRDASEDNESKQFWSFLEKDKEEIVKLLTERLKERL